MGYVVTHMYQQASFIWQVCRYTYFARFSTLRGPIYYLVIYYFSRVIIDLTLGITGKYITKVYNIPT